MLRSTIAKRMIQNQTSKKMSSLTKIIRACALALLLMNFVAAMPLHAQAPPATQQVPPATPQVPPSSDQSKKERGFGRQLTHETREAAGEEKDETAEFKESPSVQFIAKYTGLSTGHAYFLSVLLNFVVIAVLIFWAARKYLPGAFSARTAAIQKAMQEAQKASDEARRKLTEIESRLMRLDGEIGMMRDAAEKEAGAEEARIQAAAQEDARKMLESAQQEIAAAAKAARRELTAYAADLAIALAQKQIHVDAATDQTLVRTFAGELGASDTSAHAPGNGKDGR
jgi:F-type H+-transporting ATPase subunit b